MKKEFTYHSGNKSFRAFAEEETRSWGKGVVIKVYFSDSDIRSIVYFSCHPEFEDYEYYQSMCAEQLINIAITNLNSEGVQNALKEIEETGIMLCIRFNKNKKIT